MSTFPSGKYELRKKKCMVSLFLFDCKFYLNIKYMQFTLFIVVFPINRIVFIIIRFMKMKYSYIYKMNHVFESDITISIPMLF